ncbi:MAG: geranylgeranyl reductase family protein [Acidobacteria bacterium]|nr:geranylgeranyl reductase family protein [Acidobacteriota bacterium]
MPSSPNPEVLVVGGGPAGAAAAFWLADRGHEVWLVERGRYPRAKTCGDGLTPRSVYELQAMGFDFSAPGFHRCRGLRAVAGGRILELEWPAHPLYPPWGGVMRRADLDERVAALAAGRGATLLTGTEAVPVLEGGRIGGVVLRGPEGPGLARPRAVVVADGALRRFGRALGAQRDRRAPIGVGARTYFASPRSGDGYLESYLDLHDAAGSTLPGYGWVFPLGDGAVNAGVGVISTFHRWREVNTRQLMEALLATAPSSWGLGPEGSLGEVRGGILPMAGSVGPAAGPNWVLAGDAAGMVNPFNGEGIAYAYQTGRLAAEHVHRALAAGDLTLLQSYRQDLDDRFGLYHRVGRVFSRALGRPGVMWVLTRVGLRSRPLMEWALRVMSDMLDPADRGVGAAAYRLIERIVRVWPEP